MKTVCSHCNKLFQVPERALGKRAQCKACGQVFVVRPEGVDDVPMQEVGEGAMVTPDPPRPVVSRPSRPQDSDDPLAALAQAADSSQHDYADQVQQHARDHGSYLSKRDQGEHGDTAPGAVAALVMGILGVVLAPIVIGGVFSVLAVVYGNGARRRIRRSRGVLEGRGQATAGMLLGWAGLLLLALAGIGVLIWLISKGQVVVKQTTKPA